MSWDVAKQLRYIKIADKSDKDGWVRAKKLVSDACLDGLTSGQHFLIEDALAEAYRAGAIDAIFGEPKEGTV